MRAEELDKLLKWFFDGGSRLRSFASWCCVIAMVCTVFSYFATTIDAGTNDYNVLCSWRDEQSGNDYYQPKGYKLPNRRVCDGEGNIDNPLNWSAHTGILKFGLPIVFTPFLLVFLNGGVLGFRVAARRGMTAVKTSAVSKAIDATTKRRLAEVKSDKMERKLEAAQAELDRLMES